MILNWKTRPALPLEVGWTLSFDWRSKFAPQSARRARVFAKEFGLVIRNQGMNGLMALLMERATARMPYGRALTPP